MKIAFVHNLRRDPNDEEQAEFDTPETVEQIHSALCASLHEVVLFDASQPLTELVPKLVAYAPDLVFNTAEGQRGRARAAQVPALLEMLGVPVVGSDAFVMAVTQDKWLTKQSAAALGIPTPPSRLLFGSMLPTLSQLSDAELLPMVPGIVKPNYEGSSKGISDDSVALSLSELRTVMVRQLERYPQGVLVERFLPGRDVTVPFVEALGPTIEDAVLSPIEYVVEAEYASKHNLYDYRLKNLDYTGLSLRCPAAIPESDRDRLRLYMAHLVRGLGIRDFARADFRVDEHGALHFIEVNALPSLEYGAGLFVAAERAGYSYEATISAIVSHAVRRIGEKPR